MSDYDRWLEPPSTRREDFERTEYLQARSHTIPGSVKDCSFEGDIEGTLFVEDGNGWWQGDCPLCGEELSREINLYAEAEDRREQAAIDYRKDER